MMSSNFYQKTNIFLFSLSICGTLLMSSFFSGSYAMDEEQEPLRSMFHNFAPKYSKLKENIDVLKELLHGKVSPFFANFRILSIIANPYALKYPEFFSFVEKTDNKDEIKPWYSQQFTDCAFITIPHKQFFPPEDEEKSRNLVESDIPYVLNDMSLFDCYSYYPYKDLPDASIQRGKSYYVIIKPEIEFCDFEKVDLVFTHCSENHPTLNIPRRQIVETCFSADPQEAKNAFFSLDVPGLFCVQEIGSHPNLYFTRLVKTEKVAKFQAHTQALFKTLDEEFWYCTPELPKETGKLILEKIHSIHNVEIHKKGQ